MRAISLDDLNSVNRKQISRAGPRYKPGLDPTAPNVEIGELAFAFAALGGQEETRVQIRELEDAVRDGDRWKARTVERAFRGATFTPERVADSLRHLADSELDGRNDVVRELQRAIRRTPSSPGTTATSPGASTKPSTISPQTSSTNDGYPNNPNERRRCPICLDPAQSVDAFQGRC
jgi:hypothetical protein